jgi:hypothetical protein
MESVIEQPEVTDEDLEEQDGVKGLSWGLSAKIEGRPSP